MSEEQALAGSPPASSEFTSSAQTETPIGQASEPQPAVNGGGQRQSEAVPYERFQEVNATLQELKQEAAAYGYDDVREFQRALRDAYENGSGQANQGYPSEAAGAPNPEFAAMQHAVTQMAFQQGFSGLKERFPHADQAEVWDSMSYGRYQGSNALERAVQASHQKHEQIRQRAIAEHLEQQRKSAGAGAEGAGGAAAGGGTDWGKMPSDEFQRRRQAMLANS